MAKIDKINVGGVEYEINLPTTATPEITSLTVSEDLYARGGLTARGKANIWGDITTSSRIYTHSITTGTTVDPQTLYIEAAAVLPGNPEPSGVIASPYVNESLGSTSRPWPEIHAKYGYIDDLQTSDNNSYINTKGFLTFPSSSTYVGSITSGGRTTRSYGNVFKLGVSSISQEYLAIAFGYAIINAGTANTTISVVLPTRMRCFSIVATQNDIGGNNQPQYYNAIKVDNPSSSSTVSTFSLYVYPSETLQINYIAIGYTNN